MLTVTIGTGQSLYWIDTCVAVALSIFMCAAHTTILNSPTITVDDSNSRSICDVDIRRVCRYQERLNQLKTIQR